LPAGRGKEPAETAESESADITEAADTAEAVESTETTPADPEVTDAEPEPVAVEVVESSTESTESTETSEAAPVEKKKTEWSRVFAYGVLPAVALLLALAAGFARWEYNSSEYGAVPPAASQQNPSPAFDSVNAAKDSTIKMLSYKPDTVEQQLNSARDLLTGEFRDSYTSLINDVVIPGATQKQISAVASVPAAASISADPTHAVVLVFVNQTVVVGQELPTDTASSVRVTLDKVDGRWLISEFEPV
jgi:Mce-associated membrane protein